MELDAVTLELNDLVVRTAQEDDAASVVAKLVAEPQDRKRKGILVCPLPTGVSAATGPESPAWLEVRERCPRFTSTGTLSAGRADPGEARDLEGWLAFCG